jgi:Transglycosylase SLT domain
MKLTPAFVVLVLVSFCALPCGTDAAAEATLAGNTSQADPAPPLAGKDVASAGTKAAVRSEAEHWVKHYARVYGVPVALVDAIIEQESGWNPHAVSKKGAVGLMQLMPATAKRFGVHNRFRVDENIRGGVAYLAWLGEKCHGDVRLMSAAYYGGEYQIVSRRTGPSPPAISAYVRQVGQKYRRGRQPMVHPGVPHPQRDETPVPDTSADASSSDQASCEGVIEAECSGFEHRASGFSGN